MTSSYSLRHPETWTRDNVSDWLAWCVREYDISHVPMKRFDMNGKALCLLTRKDFLERIPDVGDVVYNALRIRVANSSPNEESAIVRHSRLPTYDNRPIYISPAPTPVEYRDAQYDKFLVTCLNNPPTRPVFQRQVFPVQPRKTVHILPKPRPLSDGETQPQPTNPIPDGVLSPTSTTGTDVVVESKLPPLLAAPQDAPLAASSSVRGSLNRPARNDKERTQRAGGRMLWEFILHLLDTKTHADCIRWDNEHRGVFRIAHPAGLAKLWGLKKNRPNMTYEKLSRALRYYYRMDIIRKVPGKRLTYRFVDSLEAIRKNRISYMGDSGKQFVDPQQESSSKPDLSHTSDVTDMRNDQTVIDSSHSQADHLTQAHIAEYRELNKQLQRVYKSRRPHPYKAEGIKTEGESDSSESLNAVPQTRLWDSVQTEPEDLSIKSIKREAHDVCLQRNLLSVTDVIKREVNDFHPAFG